jgi:hypothetical protein
VEEATLRSIHTVNMKISLSPSPTAVLNGHERGAFYGNLFYNERVCIHMARV